MMGRITKTLLPMLEVVGFMMLITLVVVGEAEAQGSVPNTFTTGDTAVAADVNANFQVLVDAINAISTCAGNDSTDVMVDVGRLCVDKYEASVWDSVSGGTQITGTLPCNITGNDCSTMISSGGTLTANPNAIFARSVVGVTPGASISWFQAQQACGNAGKRLLTNAEWQMAAAGTPDPGTNDGANDCVVSSAALESTGSRTNCTSSAGVNDMVGNLWEWVADWMQDNEDLDGGSISTATFGKDGIFGVDEASPGVDRFPAALLRGGDWDNGLLSGVFSLSADFAPSTVLDNVGFRCARSSGAGLPPSLFVTQ